jgi:ABC-2 type transport system permease protein
VSRASAIALRELASYFLTPAGYVIVALFLMATAFVFFVVSFDQGQIASMRPVLQSGTWLLLFVAPAISMKSLSEEYRLGSFEMLMTAPVTESQVVIGKYAGCLLFLAAALAPTFICVAALEMHGRPDYGELACGYAGLLLAGAAYLATGVLVSTFTSSQVVAYLATLFIWLLFILATEYLPQFEPAANAFGAAWTGAFRALAPGLRLRNFAIGLVDTADIVYFGSIAAVAIVASIQSLQWRRSR